VRPERLHIFRYFGIILFSLLFQNCEEEQNLQSVYQNREEVQQSPEQPCKIQFLDSWYLGNCFAMIGFRGYTAIIIKDFSSYVQFGNSVRMPRGGDIDCSKAELPYVDFDNYFLVARFTAGSGCSVKYLRNIDIDVISKTLLYKIEVNYYGACKLGITNFNWVLIPQKYSDYDLKYDVKETSYPLANY
jgi:hypothetical protein